MKTCDKSEIVSAIKDMKSNKCKLVGIHGAPGVGKSKLARALSKLLYRANIGAVIVALDDCIPSGPKGRYPDYLDKQKLSRKISSAKETHEVVLIEGICLLEILEKISVGLDFIIYVISQYNTGTNEDIDNKTLAVKLEEINSLLPNPNSSNLEKDNAIYHNRYKPVENSDYVCVWKKDS